MLQRESLLGDEDAEQERSIIDREILIAGAGEQQLVD